MLSPCKPVQTDYMYMLLLDTASSNEVQGQHRLRTGAAAAASAEHLPHALANVVVEAGAVIGKVDILLFLQQHLQGAQCLGGSSSRCIWCTA